MHEDAPTLKATTREKTGSRYSRRVREAGGLPANVYGHKQDPVAVTLDAHSTLLMLHRGEKVFSLEMEGVSESQFVLLKEVQYDYLGTNIVHCDLERVDLDERVKVTVQLQFVGDAVGLKTAGATLMHPATELDLECAVMNLPDSIEVDVSGLGVGESIKAGDVTLPKPTMKLLSDPGTDVAMVLEPKVTEEAETDEAAVVEGEG